MNKTYKIGKEILEIVVDEDGSDPREWDNLGKMLCYHDRYDLGDKDLGYDINDYDGWEEMEEAIIKEEKALVILPLYLYDHGGITINTTGFSCPWDSSQIGFIYATEERIKEFMGVKKIGKRLLKKVEKELINEVKIYDQYLTGDVYGFSIEKVSKCKCCGSESNEHVDSCYGFFGSDFEENGMLDYIDKKWHKKILEDN